MPGTRIGAEMDCRLTSDEGIQNTFEDRVCEGYLDIINNGSDRITVRR